MDPKQAPPSAGDCEAVEELIAAYAFGLTDADEARRVEESLASCHDTAAHLADYRQLQDEMRASVPQVEPPARLAARLAAAIAAPAVAAPAPVAVTPVKSRWMPARAAWALAAAALVALALTNVYWMTRVNALTAEQTEYPLTNNSNGGAFVLTDTSNLRWVRLPAVQPDGRASAFLCWDAASKTGLLYVWGFPQLQPGQTFQLWLTRGEVRASAGTFAVDESGRNVVLFHSAEPIDEFTWSRITVEAAAGSAQPGESVVVAGEL